MLPEFDDKGIKEKLTLEEMRSHLKEKGIVPHKKWNEKPMLIACTGNNIKRTDKFYIVNYDTTETKRRF